MGKKLQIGLLALGAAVVVALSVLAIQNVNSPPPAATASSPQAPDETAPTPDPAAGFAPINGDPPSALIVGDSYAGGIGATTPAQGYAETLAAELGWDADIESASGGGYGKPGADGPSVLELLKRADLASYDVIVVQSGYNDVSEDDSTVADAVSQTRQLLDNQAPDVPVVVVGAFWPSDLTPSAEARAGTIRSEWVNRPGVLFLDPLAGGWSDFATVDGVHPDDAGHDLIASKIEAGMRDVDLL
ncbi:MAG: SGNH/GDSL hydrolase family protein [Nocardioides sp.]